MTEQKFDTKKLDKLNNPERLKTINPKIIWETLNIQNAEVLIDIGAGTGFFAKEFINNLNSGKIYACDSSDIMVDWMRENINNENIIPTKCFESSINLPDNIADLVYMINVHHELLEPEKLLNESYRLLKQDGKIAIIDWKAEEMQDGPLLKLRIPAEKIVEQLKNTGFKNIENSDKLSLQSFIIGQK